MYRENLGRIDLVILDVIMPRMNGREALAAIHAEGTAGGVFVYERLHC